ncbi:MAG: protein translocase subunit SecF [Faecalibacterium sp.]|jgi:SecD/SecF fusion protein|nr:protein translocase subunit SecF [Faecalibacterium sp.]
MKTRGKAWQLILTVLLILVFAWSAFFGLKMQYGDTVSTYIKGASDIRFGIDIKGGVNATFRASDGYDATAEQLEAAQTVIENRLVALNITDYEIYIDNNDNSIILEFPWQSDEADFDPEAAIQEIGTTAYMTFRKGDSADGELILDGSEVQSAEAAYGQVDSSGQSEYYVALTFDDAGKTAFGDATTALYSDNGTISIWLDDKNVSTANVNAAITDGKAIITNPNFTQEQVVTLARQINSGALPFSLTVDSYSTVSPSLGENSLEAMVLAGVIAFAMIFLFMTFLYRLPGFLAGIALLGQVAATLAFVSGYFSVFSSFTLTLPGIAGIILAIGMGVDANVITAERIKEELGNGKSIDGALRAGFQRGLTPIIDGNVTIVIVAVVLMGAFGPTDGFFAKLLRFVFFAFGASTTGTIYAFGYTLLIGVLLNFVFGVFATRVMIRGAAAIPALRKPWLYGAKDNQPIAVNEALPKARFDLMGKRKKFLTFSSCLMAAIVLCALVLGVKLDTQFTGGAILTMSYTGSPDMAGVQQVAAEALDEKQLTLRTGSSVGTGESTITITMPGTETVTTDQVSALVDNLNEQYPDNAFAQLSLSNVSATMGTKFLQKSLVAVIFALAMILLYIAVRFPKIGGFTGGAMAIIALLNDLMVVFGTFVLLRAPLDGNFIAVLLTILGYSINDTVVIYDRIREDRKLMGNKLPFEELVNLSVNQSLRRTINTTLTTVMALIVMCIVAKVYGLNSLFIFVFPLTTGMISGVYTTLCIATSCWVTWNSRKKAQSQKAVPEKAKKNS